jgi:hypothetical protein
MPIAEFYICVFFKVEYPKLLGVSSFHQQNSSGISTIFRIIALELWFAGQIPQEPAKEEEGGGWGSWGSRNSNGNKMRKILCRELVYLDLKQPFLEIDGNDRMKHDFPTANERWREIEWVLQPPMLGILDFGRAPSGGGTKVFADVHGWS